MLRLLIHSRDLQLRNLLGPTLGPDFRLVVESDRARTKDLVMMGACDVLILDTEGFPPGHVLDLFDDIRGASIPAVAMASDANRALALELVERGVYDSFRRPPVIAELKKVVLRAHENATLKQHVKAASRQIPETAGCDGMVGSSGRSTVVYDLIRRVCGLDAFVLITGESGTGKELIARAIHNLSPRKKSPFVTVSCGAIPETLIEAELFGYEKGAFTGAFGRRTGYLEQAGDGTLFLDEIGELSLHTQVKLLRVLQEREFSRLGSGEMVPLRARIVFATHRNLADMVREGTFRQDLYYRVNVMGIKSPPLRDRSDDIPVLARHFVAKYAEAYGASAPKLISPSAMALLVEHDWPGNIRELENVMQRALIVSDGDEIRPEHLPDTLQCPDLLGVGETLPSGSFEDQLQAFKLALARRAVHDCKGNKTMAAQSLQISRTYLHRLIREPGEIGELEAA
jgi:DNA-binding NtrC family response regulator